MTDFPFDLGDLSKFSQSRLIKLSKKLEVEMKKRPRVRRKSGLLIESVDSRSVKTIIDEIDRVLGLHYGFTDEELDYIINYDVKYRLGQEDNADEE